MSLIIPWGVFARYVLGTGSQWPEPIAILLMVVFTFLGAAAAYRAGAHIAVAMLTDRAARRRCASLFAWLVRPADAGGRLFMAGLRHASCAWDLGPDDRPTALDAGRLHLPPVPLGGSDHRVFVLEQHAARSPAVSAATVVTFDHETETEAQRRLSDGRARPARLASCVLMLIGMPVAYALGLAALIGALWIDMPLDAVMIQIASGVNKFSLLAIPFFVLAGAIMAEGGMARRLVAFASVLVGFVRGGLSLVNILASTFFGAISGSSVADTASIGSVLIPEMEKKGYPRDFATARDRQRLDPGHLIPPSHNAVIYSLAAGGSVSIAALFVAGVLPGLLLGLTLAVLCLFIAQEAQLSRRARRSRCGRRCRSASMRCGA